MLALFALKKKILELLKKWMMYDVRKDYVALDVASDNIQMCIQ